MRFLASLSIVFFHWSFPMERFSGNVFVDASGTYHLSEQKQDSWFEPTRGYLFGQTLRYSQLTKEALQDIPTIGPSLAKKIMDVQQITPNPTWNDIDEISGVGEKTLQLLKKHIDLTQ